jgi:succinoglycan biosynthesis protein ExoA
MPKVSIIIPCYNEQSTIRLLLEALHKQTFPHTNAEVIISDGMSTDGTRAAVAAFQTDFPDFAVRVVDNSQRTIPSAVNRALEVSRGEIVVRLDAHSKPYPDYIEKCVNLLEAGVGDNVGGVWEIQPGANTWTAKAIAAAAAHPLAVGDAMYRHTKRAAEVDTVPFGSFKRKLIDKVGFFNETLLTNEDYEFNVRVKKAGGRIWLDPSIRSIYFARSSLLELMRQYWRYGFWKWRMLRHNPETLRWRQALPPLFVFSLVGLTTLAFFVPSAWWLLLGELFLYFFTLIVAGALSAFQQKKLYLLPGLVLVIPVMHITWGIGFLWSMLLSRSQKNGR